MKYANTGDIILFKGFSKAASVQRFFTRSKYDHVAVILRAANDRLLLFESTSELGVSILDWKVFYEIGWLDKYDRIVYRKLKYHRNEETINKASVLL